MDAMAPHEDSPLGLKHLLLQLLGPLTANVPQLIGLFGTYPLLKKNCVVQDLPNIMLLLRHRLHSMAGQWWIMSQAVLLPEFRTTLKRHPCSGSLCWVGRDLCYNCAVVQLPSQPNPAPLHLPGVMTLRILSDKIPAKGICLRAYCSAANW